MKRVVTGHEVLGLLSKAVLEKGRGYVYKDHFDSCRNFGDDGEPQCIVGHVLFALDLTPRECGNFGVGVVVSRLKQDKNPIRFSAGAQAMLAAAQGVQDRGGTWGLAIEAARSVSSVVTD